MHRSLSLCFSVNICKKSLNPDQTQMELGKNVSSIKKFVHAIERLQSVNTVECPTLSYKS